MTDNYELGHDLVEALLKIKKTQTLLDSHQGDEVAFDGITVNDREIKICYTAETHGGGAYVLNALGRELDLLGLQPKSILECFCGPAFLGFYALAKYPQTQLTLTDINPQVKPLIDATVKENAFQNTQLYLGNCLENVPPETFDLILANPPWWSHETDHLKDVKKNLSPTSREILFLDKGFEKHKTFFTELKQCTHDQSVIILLEGQAMGDELAGLAKEQGFSSTIKSVDYLIGHDEIPRESFPVWIILKPCIA
jgi:methylase of polypeptide subunit release factors